MTQSAEEDGEVGEPRFADLLATVERCGVRTRGGGTCERPAVPDRHRCIVHGGTAGHGAPKGNRNRLTHGARTRAAMAERKALNAMIREAWRMVREIEKG